VRRDSVPVSRQTFLKGLGGMAVAAGTRNLWTGRSPAQGRSAHPHRDLSANVTVDLSSGTGKTIQPDLYGYATGALLDNDFQLAANR
jgi:hypothetical protein